MKRSRLADYADKIENNYDSYKNFRNQALQKWHDRTKNLKDSKNPLTNLNIMTKIENALLGKNEIIKKSQIFRGDYEIYGLHNALDKESTEEVHLPEIYDDSDFYHQLLRELIEHKSNSGENETEITQKFIELQKVRSKMKKKVETRASKGRKIRYNVHNKLVNFMPSRDNSEWTEEAKTELFSSLFGSLTEAK
jgi:protein AATF/BFR2